MAAQDLGHQLAAAGGGDVIDLGWIDPDLLGDQAGQDLVAAAGRAAAPGHRARIGLELADRSCSDLIGESVGTTRAVYSPVSRASGVT